MLIAFTPSQISITSADFIESSLAVNSNGEHAVSMLSVSFTGVEHRKLFLKLKKKIILKL